MPSSNTSLKPYPQPSPKIPRPQLSWIPRIPPFDRLVTLVQSRSEMLRASG
jgi:hypothetical protein